MTRFFLLASLLLSFGTALAEDVRLTMPGNEELVFTLPNEWIAQTRPTIPGQPHTARITTKDSSELLFLISALVPARADISRPSDESVKAAVSSAAERARRTAIEPDIPIVDLKISGAHAYYYFATDRNPAPNEYKFLIQGQIGLGEVTVLFTVLMNGDPQRLSARALDAVKSIRRQPRRNAT